LAWTRKVCFSSVVLVVLQSTAPAQAQSYDLGAAGSAFQPTPTPADQRDQTGPVPVTQRARPELEPGGAWFGGFHFLPSGSVISLFDSNIFAAQSPVSDVVFHLRPELKIESAPSAFTYDFGLVVDRAQYVDHSVLDNTNVATSLGIAGDLGSRVRFDSRTSFTHDHSAPTVFILPSPNGTVLSLPAHTNYGQQAAVTSDFGRFVLIVTGGIQRDEYEDVVVNGVVFQQSQLNATTVDLSPKIAYDITPLLRGFVLADVRHQNDANGLFNATTYALSGGVDFEFRRLFRGTTSFGYRVHDYDTSGAGSVSGLTYGIDLAWFPTELLTVSISGKQDFSDTILVGTGGRPATNDVKTIKLGADYEVLRQVILSGGLSYESDDFSSTTRHDDVLLLSLGSTYSINRNVALTARYNYLTRSSSQSGFGYDDHQVALALKLGF
jgi:hypothetical protein